jgi:hypothetical protein
MGGIWYYTESRKQPEHDYETENKILYGEIDKLVESEDFHKNRADKAEHSFDSILAIKPKVILKYYEKDHDITLLSADSTHNLLLSNAQTDSIWK